MPNLLTNIIIWTYAVYKRIFTVSDYTVSKVFLEYDIDPARKY